MRVEIRFEVDVTLEVPDDFCSRVRLLQFQLGENHYGIRWSNQQILERVARIRGLRHMDHDEGLDDELNAAIRIIEIADEYPIESFEIITGESR